MEGQTSPTTQTGTQAQEDNEWSRQHAIYDRIGKHPRYRKMYSPEGNMKYMRKKHKTAQKATAKVKTEEGSTPQPVNGSQGHRRTLDHNPCQTKAGRDGSRAKREGSEEADVPAKKIKTEKENMESHQRDVKAKDENATEQVKVNTEDDPFVYVTDYQMGQLLRWLDFHE